MKLHYIPIMVLVVGLIVLGTTTYITDLGDNYGATADFTTINKTTSKMGEMKNASDDMKAKIDEFKSDDSEGGTFLMPYRFLTTAWSALRFAYASFTVFGAVIEDTGAAAAEVGVSSEVSNQLMVVIITSLTIIVIAIIAYAFFKWKFED